MVNCDTCKKDFNLDVKITKYDGGVEKIHFYCPHCNQEYISYFTDPAIRKKQARIRVLYSKLGKKKLKKMQDEILKDMQNLGVKMLGTQ